MNATRVLVVDDDEDDYLIVRDMLAGLERGRFTVDWRGPYRDALREIAARRHDVYLIDYRLGEHTGLELVREGFASGPRPPVILLTGHAEYEIDLEATALGVTDYVIKQGLDAAGLERSIRYAISHHKALHDLRRSEERYALAARATNDGIWDWDLQTGRIYFSPRWHSILGRPDTGTDHDPAVWFDLVHWDDLVRVRAAIDGHLSGRTPHLQVEHSMRHTDGSWRWVLNRGLAIRDQSGLATRIAGSMADITERRTAELQLQHDALHDGLTGLPNRTLLTDRLGQIVERSARDPSLGGALLFLDIDRFKLVNDSLGHAIGDELLVALGARLTDLLRPGDTVARIGGDEFLLLLDGVATEADAAAIVERVQKGLARPFTIGAHELFLTASIGLSLSTPSSSAAELLRDADTAMYDAKRRGSGSVTVFDDSMRRRAIDRLRRENELRQAIDHGLLDVHYQPIVDLRDGHISGLEALARWPMGWPHVAPLTFIQIAEESGLIRQLGLHVLRAALLAFAGWRRGGLLATDACISVNVSRRQLTDPTLRGEIVTALSDARLPAEALRLEITETTLMHEHDQMQRIVADVCATGVGLHLDDFGTGYSSLSSLRQFPVEAIKIDRSLITSTITGEDGGDAIVLSTIALARGLGLTVIAEGIERPSELAILRSLGCDHGQGYLLSRPLAPEEITTLLAEWTPESIASHHAER